MPRSPDLANKGFALRMGIAHRHSKWRDLNQTELGRVFGVSPSCVSTWFAWKRVPYDDIISIANEFEVSADWLLTGRDPMRPYPPSPLIALAQDLMMLDEKTVSVLFFLVRMIQKGVLSHQKLVQSVQVLAECGNPLSVD